MNPQFAEAIARVILEYQRFERRVATGSHPGLEEARAWFVKAVDGLDELSRSAQGREDDVRLVRCALVCWVDEMLTQHTPWNERKPFRHRCLELHFPQIQDLPGRPASRIRAPVEAPTLFYEAAELAKARPDPEAIETFLTCVTLGFRGRHRREEARRDWVEETRRHLKARRRADDASGPRVASGSGPRPLFGDHLRLWTAVFAGLLGLIALASFIIAVHLSPY